ncbi:MAG TPA: VOC family protein [Bdellovibrionota bacterium]|nr:VOC family protein [Bdellovibrionota bacterium]
MLQYLHTMIRVGNLEKSLRFYTEGLGFKLLRKSEYPDGKFTLAFLRAPGDGDSGPALELTFNWHTESYQRGDGYGHVAYLVESIADVQAKLKSAGFDLSWGPGSTPDGRRKMAFVDDPDGYEIELLEGRP